jgi:small-conductance mechanosensitive channel
MEYLDTLLGYVIPIAVILAFVMSGYIARYILERYLASWAKKTETKLDDIIIQAIRMPLLLWFLLAGIWIALEYVKLPAAWNFYVDKGMLALIIFSVAVAVIQIFTGIIRYYGTQIAAFKPISGIAEGAVKILILAIGVMMILSAFGIEITPLLTTLGIAGLAVAIALGDTLANFFAGLYIVADQPVRVGDYIKLETGDEGYVERIGWRSTRIRTLPNNIVIVPNQKLAQSIVTNYFLPEKRMSLRINVDVSYACDPKKVEEVLVDIATKSAGEVEGLLREPAPFVRFIPGFMDYSMRFTLICQVREFVDQYYVQHELRKRIYERFKQEGIEIPFPIRTVYLKESK